MPTDSLTQLRDDIGTRLSTDASFSTAPATEVVNEEGGDLEQKIKAAISKLGVLCVVPTPRLGPGNLNVLLQALIRVDFFENVLLNRQGSSFKTAPQLLLCAFNGLRGWPPTSGAWKELVFTNHEYEVKGTAIHHTLHFTVDLLC